MLEEYSVGEKNKVDIVLNLTGLRCPNPTMITEKKLEGMQAGEILEVICNDKTARQTIPALCRKASYEIIETREEKGLILYIIKK